MSIRHTGHHYAIHWQIRDGASYTGAALETEEFLAAGWGESKNAAVIVYDMHTGTLSGRWASIDGSGKLGTEQLSGPTNLHGSYAIVEGFTPQGDEYGGTVSIAPHGNAYRIIWTRGGSSENGVGIKKGNRLFAARGGNGAAVMVYTATKTGALSGQWAQPSGAQLGTEFLAK